MFLRLFTCENKIYRERREVVSAADADEDAGDDHRRAYGGPRTRGRTSRDVTAGRKGREFERRIDTAISAIREEPLRAAI